jgi:hypothetical protein
MDHITAWNEAMRLLGVPRNAFTPRKSALNLAIRCVRDRLMKGLPVEPLPPLPPEPPRPRPPPPRPRPPPSAPPEQSRIKYSHTISKSAALREWRLTAVDLQDLPTHYTTRYSLNDVRRAAWTKHGGRHGFEAYQQQLEHKRHLRRCKVHPSLTIPSRDLLSSMPMDVIVGYIVPCLDAPDMASLFRCNKRLYAMTASLPLYRQLHRMYPRLSVATFLAWHACTDKVYRTTAKQQWLMRESELCTLPYKCVRNPHYTSQISTLYNVCDILVYIALHRTNERVQSKKDCDGRSFARYMMSLSM